MGLGDFMKKGIVSIFLCTVLLVCILPLEVRADSVYVGSRADTRYHTQGCPYMLATGEGNKLHWASQTGAVAASKAPCPECIKGTLASKVELTSQDLKNVTYIVNTGTNYVHIVDCFLNDGQRKEEMRLFRSYEDAARIAPTPCPVCLSSLGTTTPTEPQETSVQENAQREENAGGLLLVICTLSGFICGVLITSLIYRNRIKRITSKYEAKLDQANASLNQMVLLISKEH